MITFIKNLIALFLFGVIMGSSCFTKDVEKLTLFDPMERAKFNVKASVLQAEIVSAELADSNGDSNQK